ncbi:MAG: acylphosphatase [Proteobacteria bacterium]|nr:acylphosphatase [Pseudomonadota bacterium]MBU1639218.1 acylphosphatase [Pseudomonadota bacterium]
MERCVRAVVSGKVQGVFFRAFTLEEAESHNLSGWVRNLPSGEVETLICGPSAAVDLLLDWLATGTPQSRVDHVTVEELSCPDPALHGFTIRQ